MQALALLSRYSLRALRLLWPPRKATSHLLIKDQSKLTTRWSRGMASVTFFTGLTGVTSRRVPFCSASLNASVPAPDP